MSDNFDLDEFFGEADPDASPTRQGVAQRNPHNGNGTGCPALFGHPTGNGQGGASGVDRVGGPSPPAPPRAQPGTETGSNLARPAYTLDEILQRACPLSPQENHPRLLYLARGVKTLEQQEGRAWTLAEQRERAVVPWVQQNRHREPGKSVDQYFLEFLECHRDAKYLLGGNVLDQAWTAAEDCTTFPQVARQLEDPQLRQLVLWCRELQRLAGSKPFFLACRSVQERFGLNHAMQARTWLRGLEALGILRPEEKGVPGRRKATRWRYLYPLDG